MLHCMATSQLAVRFTPRQLRTLDALARRSKSTRSAVVKHLVDEAERELIASAYIAGYPEPKTSPDGFGDLGALHEASEADRLAARADETGW